MVRGEASVWTGPGEVGPGRQGCSLAGLITERAGTGTGIGIGTGAGIGAGRHRNQELTGVVAS